jgi:hypothetical protein
MSTSKVARLRKEFTTLRRKGGVKTHEIEALAAALGRIRHQRGKEPTWINPDFPRLRPVSIPHHSKDLNRFTAQSILDQLEPDLEALEELQDEQEG